MHGIRWCCGFVMLGALSLALAGDAQAEDEEGGKVFVPPSEFTPVAGALPKYVPGEPPESAEGWRDWSDRAAAEGRLHAGTRRGGDLLFSAAEPLRFRAPHRARYIALCREAIAAFPRGDVTIGYVLMQLARVQINEGMTSATEETLEQLRPWMDAREPTDLDVSEAERWRLFRDHVRRHFLPVTAKLHAANGRLQASAETLERFAEESRYRGLVAEADAWMDAARAYYKADDREAAVRSADRSLELTTVDLMTARRGKWRLFAKHGLVAPDGSATLFGTWPGEEFEADMRGFLRSLHDNYHSGELLLSFGSSAHMCGRNELALEMYLLALDHRDLVAKAAGDPTIVGGLLVGMSVAVELERFDEAERILSTIERISDRPIKDIDKYRAAIRTARADAEAEAELRRKEAEKRRAEAKPSPASNLDERNAGRIEPPRETEDEAVAAETGDASDGSVWLWCGVGLLLALGALLLRRPRR